MVTISVDGIRADTDVFGQSCTTYAAFMHLNVLYWYLSVIRRRAVYLSRSIGRVDSDEKVDDLTDVHTRPAHIGQAKNEHLSGLSSSH